jgi:hypothetical protein
MNGSIAIYFIYLVKLLGPAVITGVLIDVPQCVSSSAAISAFI